MPYKRIITESRDEAIRQGKQCKPCEKRSFTGIAWVNPATKHVEEIPWRIVLLTRLPIRKTSEPEITL